MYTKRKEKILKKVQAKAVYITSPENLFYFSGFTGGEGALYLSADESVLLTDSRYTTQAKEEAQMFTVYDVREKSPGAFLKEKGVKTLGYEEDFVSAKTYLALKEQLDGVEFIPAGDHVLSLRAVKSPEEIEKTREAARLADGAFMYVLPFIHPGVTEKEIALRLEWYMRERGAKGPSFSFICASGPRSAMPHGEATEKKLMAGELFTMDFGCFYKGYASDMTRTVVLGKATREQRKLYDTVLLAQQEALSHIKEGKTGKEIDAISRQIIEEAGFGDYFGHGLGHGTGLCIHEYPTLSPKSPHILKRNMLVTVEPGIYIPGVGGVRIEDLVVVQENGYENLTTSDKSLIEL